MPLLKNGGSVAGEGPLAIEQSSSLSYRALAVFNVFASSMASCNC